VVTRVQLRNQEDVVCQEGVWTMLFSRRATLGRVPRAKACDGVVRSATDLEESEVVGEACGLRGVLGSCSSGGA
jgi:hypothetical protein